MKPKRKKTNLPSNNKKKSTASSSKGSIKKSAYKLDDKKIASISEKIKKINTKFETLIEECKSALCKLNNKLEVV